MNDLAFKRTLAAIVMADVVGYSRMMGEDEAGTLQRLTQYRSELIDPTIVRHRGRIVNAIGDSLLLEFGSVVDATLCAIALQQALIDRNASIAEHKRIIFRMGVNIGDVIVRDRSLFGDSVNVAARLQTLADPGGICLSNAAHEQIRQKIDAPFADAGTYQVKNIVRPIEVFALSAQAIDEMQRMSAPIKPAQSRRLIIVSAAAICLLAALAFAGNYIVHRIGTQDFAAHLNNVLSATQAKLNDRTRAKLVDDYLAKGRHRAFAIAPKAQNRWWTIDWATSALAEEKVLERCQMRFDEPCELIALDDAMVAQTDGKPRGPRDMPRVRYAGDFDPAQIPGIRLLIGERADIVGYLQAPEPKAAAIHPRGVITVATAAASPRRAEIQALKLCNDDSQSRDADGPCFLYAVGNKIVLPQRQTASVSRP